MRPNPVRTLALALALTAVTAAAAAADCFADYKAKKDAPLRLHYGVIALPDAACRDAVRAQEEIARRIAAGGWQLLTVMGLFGPEGLAERRESAGAFYLRF